MNRLLLVEDDSSLGSSLLELLKAESFDVVWAQSLAEARTSLQTHKPDLVILDIGLPDGSGLDLAREIKDKSALPIIFMTAWNTAENRLEGYEIGAEEFIPKPFHFRELLLRLNHVLQNHQVTSQIKLPQGLLDLEKMCFQDDNGQMTFLANRDFQVLQLLIESSPKPVTRDEILDKVWGLESFPSHRTVDNSILRLRQALRDEQGHLIRSVRGLGYQWILGE
ncbi:MAG: response regulator transcription factor [Bdellovibrionaceae bacterium]|nr:response regulator transcription factor [Pseudobdellovibrionaceae bacterium]